MSDGFSALVSEFVVSTPFVDALLLVLCCIDALPMVVPLPPNRAADTDVSESFPDMYKT